MNSSSACARLPPALRSVLEAIPDPVVVVGGDGRILHANRLLQTLLGYAESELIGREIELLVPESQRDRHVAARDRFLASPRQRPMGEGAELAARARDGSEIAVEISLAPLQLDGMRVVCCAVRDIRERKRAEADLRRFRAAMETSIDSIYLTDPRTLKFVDVNSAACRRLGYARDRLLGLGPADVFDFDPEQLRRDYDAVIAAGDSGVRSEREYKRSDGSRGWTELHRRAFHSDGRWLIVTVGRDITERKLAEIRARRNEEELRLVVDSVPAMIAHFDRDLRFRYVNRRYADFFELSPEAFIGKTAAEIIGEADWGALRPQFDAALAGKAQSFERRRRRADGSLRDLAMDLVPHLDAAGEVEGLYGLVLDVTARRRAERRLQEGEAQMRLVLDNVPAMIAFADAEFRYRYANRPYVDFYAGGRDVGGEMVRDVVGEEAWKFIGPNMQRALAGETVSYVRRFKLPDGFVEVEVTLVPNLDRQGRGTGVHILVLDVTKRRRAEEALRLRNRAIESSVNSIIISAPEDGRQRIVYVNPAFEHVTGYAAAEVLGQSPRFLHGDDSAQQGVIALREAAREEREAAVLIRNYRKDGTMFWNELRVAPVRDESNRVTHFIGIGNDVTERIRYQTEIERNANFDSLTGLPNRNLLNDRLAQALTKVARTHENLGVIFVDVDHLKRINDSLGHGVGDRVIAAVGRRIAAALRAGDTVARLGGDEFVILLPNLKRSDDAQRIAAKVLEQIAAPLKIDAHEFVLSASAGIALYPRDGAEPETLLRNADAALFRAKEDGRDCFRFFAPEMNDRLVRFLATERDLRAALEARQFWLQYQPIVEMKSGAIVGAEALLRWRRADGDIVSPAEFIPVAEESGLIVPIGRWVIETAACQVSKWNRSRRRPLYVSVNLSARQFRDPGLLDTVQAALRGAGVNPSLLKLEITESTVMHEPERAIVLLQALKDLGVLLSVDDFGTGYSSLAYLKRFPIDVLKIDRSFVRNLPGDAEDLALSRAIIDLARALDLDVVAEGIETRGQAELLAAKGCRFAQGYYFGRPADPDQLRLESVRTRPTGKRPRPRGRARRKP